MRTALLFTGALLLLQISSCSANKYAYKMNDSDILKTLVSGTDVVIENKTIEGNLDFTAIENVTTESPVLYRHYINAGITFVNCEFKGTLASYRTDGDKTHLATFMKSVTFLSCRFKSKVDLREVTVYGKLNFAGSTFEKNGIV